MAAKPEEIKLQKTRENQPESGASHGGDDYDPHNFRTVAIPTSNMETFVHLLKGAIGTGILAMPQGFSNAGLVTGAISTVVIGFLATYCTLTLVKSQYLICKRQRVAFMTYPESMKTALSYGPKFLRGLGGVSYYLVDFFLCIYQIGICCVYVVFIGRSVKALIDPYFEMRVEYWMFAMLPPLMIMNSIRNLKKLAPWSTVANILILIGLAFVIYYLLTAPKVEEEWDLWGSLRTYPLFFGTSLFAFITVGVIIALESNMKNPKSFGGVCGVYAQSMFCVTLIYVTIGSIGYMFCVSQCEDSISLSIPEGSFTALVVNILYTIAIFISYALQCYVPVQIIWGYLIRKLGDRPNLIYYEYGLRMFLCLLSFVVAVSVPRLGLFISLFGAFCLSVVGLAFPALMEFCVMYPNNFGPLNYILIKDILLFLFGCLGLVVGTYVSLMAIIESFQ